MINRKEILIDISPTLNDISADSEVHLFYTKTLKTSLMESIFKCEKSIKDKNIFTVFDCILDEYSSEEYNLIKLTSLGLDGGVDLTIKITGILKSTEESSELDAGTYEFFGILKKDKTSN